MLHKPFYKKALLILPEPFKPRLKLPIKCTSLWFPFTYLPPKKPRNPFS